MRVALESHGDLGPLFFGEEVVCFSIDSGLADAHPIDMFQEWISSLLFVQRNGVRIHRFGQRPLQVHLVVSFIGRA